MYLFMYLLFSNLFIFIKVSIYFELRLFYVIFNYLLFSFYYLSFIYLFWFYLFYFI